MTIATAFAALRKRHNLIARQNFWCCQGCGLNALSQEYNATAENETRPVGYVFFHKQDADTLKKEGHTYLRFGVFGKARKTTTAEIGKLVAKVLIEHGCPVDWNENPGHCLVVWRDAEARRLHALKRLGVSPSP